MIEFIVNGRPLVLLPDIQVHISFVMASLSQDQQDNFSVPFTVPVEENSIALDFAAAINLHMRQHVWHGATMRMDGAHALEGDIEYISSNDRTMDLVFVVNGFWTRAMSMNLRDLPFALIHTDSEEAMLVHAKSVNQLHWPEASHCFPMHRNTEFYGDRNPEFFPQAEPWKAGKQYHVNDLVTFEQPLNDALSLIMHDQGYQCLQDHTAVYDPKNDVLRWRRTAFGFINHWDHANQRFFRNTGPNQYALVPFFYAKWVISQACSMMGYQIHGNFIVDEQTNGIALYNNTALDTNGQDHYIRVAQDQPVQYGAGQNMHLPFTLDSGPGLADPEGIWDTEQSTYTVPSAGQYKFVLQANILFDHPDFPTIQVVDAITDTVRGASPSMSYWSQDSSTHWPNKVVVCVLHFSVADVGRKFYVRFMPDVMQGSNGASISGGILTINQILIAHTNAFSPTIEPANHMPDMSFGELLVELLSMLNVRVVPDPSTRKIKFDYNQKIGPPRDPVVDITQMLNGSITITPQDATRGLVFHTEFDDQQLPDLANYERIPDAATEFMIPEPQGPLQYVVVRNSRKLFTSGAAIDQGPWKHVGYLLGETRVGDPNGAHEIKPAFGPMRMDLFSINGYYFLMPMIEEAGNTTRFGGKYNAPSLRVVNYHGMWPNKEQIEYPFASPYTWDDSGNIANYELSLSLTADDPSTVYNQFWKEWALMIATATPVRFNLLVSPDFVLQQHEANVYLIGSQHYRLVELPMEFSVGMGLHMAQGTRAIQLKEHQPETQQFTNDPILPEQPVSVCDGPNTASVVVAPGGSAWVSAEAINTTHFTIRNTSQTLTFINYDSANPGEGPWCIYASDAEGNPVGDLLYVEATGDLLSVDVSRPSTLIGVYISSGEPSFTLAPFPNTLTQIQLDYIPFLSSLGSLADFEDLELVYFLNLGSLTSLPDFSPDALVRVTIADCGSLVATGVLPKIKNLYIWHTGITDPAVVDALVNALHPASASFATFNGLLSLRTSASDTNYNACISAGWTIT